MSRLTEKLQKAAGVAGRISSKIEARADSLIARESAIEAKTDQAFAPHEALLGEAERGLTEVEDSLRALTNGGPPLEPSTPSPDSSQGFLKPGHVSADPPIMRSDGTIAPPQGNQRIFDRMG